jgi:hypothetical protein
MKNWRSLLLTAIAFLGISTMVLFSSCEQDPCAELNCQNGGVCSDGFCRCPIGFEGSECTISTASRFVGTYLGSRNCSDVPPIADSITIELISDPNIIRLHLGSETNPAIELDGTATNSEAQLDYKGEGIEIHAYVTIEGNNINVFLQTVYADGREICQFTGTKIEED